MSKLYIHVYIKGRDEFRGTRVKHVSELEATCTAICDEAASVTVTIRGGGGGGYTLL